MTNPIKQTELAEVLRDIQSNQKEILKEIGDTRAEIDLKIESVKGDIKVLSEKNLGIEKRLSNIETSVQKIPDLSEKVGELKNWKQIGVIMITALISSIFTGTIGGFIGYSIRSLKP
jgi:chromosome segregation ATPase